MRKHHTVGTPGPRFGIGELSESTDCKAETIRYYERIGLLPDPPRSSGGHRVYSGKHLRRLRFIRRGRSLGFTLEQIRELLSLADGGELSCRQARRITRAHLDDLRKKLANLGEMEAVLGELSDRCDGGETSDCPIIEDLFQSS